MRWERLLSSERLGTRSGPAPDEARNEFQRDFDRIVFSPAFRRLHDKTQVFPMPENDHVHSRLTHSLEVSCVGRGLATRVGRELVRRRGLDDDDDARDIGDIVAAACLAHDIGNPPFGHSGEHAFRSWFRERRDMLAPRMTPEEWADLEGFEGNAQGFRVITRLQMARGRGGMRLTHATLGAYMKYPRASIIAVDPGKRRSGKKHGFHRSERDLFAETAEVLGLPPVEGAGDWWRRHPLVFLTEAADDICYQILDLEDGYRLGKVAFDEARDLLAAIVPEKSRHGVETAEERRAFIGYLRARAVDALIRETADLFLEKEEEILAGAFDGALVDAIPSKEKVDAITRLVLHTCYQAPEVLETEIAGFRVIAALLDRFVEATLEPSRPGAGKIRILMPDLFREAEGDDDYRRILRITDFVSGMTDGYAVSVFRRLQGIVLPR
ncbi:MAG: deoxyguanosinetriphosphate triphosphohydrolase [Candidatus Eisenbacteria bacterium]|nr:deoxyguanosinetriphosphate triphosphohydrolase [Candidatus Eisenbacteria bacterium]